MTTFRCNKCQGMLPREAFGNDRQKPDGRRRTCRECDRVRRQEAWTATLEQSHGRAARYRREKAEQVREAKRRYQQSERGRLLMLQASKRYRETERGRALIREKNRRLAQLEKHRLTNRLRCGRRRARLLEAPGMFTQEDWLRTLAGQENRCRYCGQEFTVKKPATVDHVVPLSKGGAHSPENIVAACRVCNSRKYNRMVPVSLWAGGPLASAE